MAMVARAVSYFGDPFKGQRGMTQGDPLYPTIFNMVVDAVLRNWVIVLIAMEEILDPRTEGYRREIQRLAEYFYSNNSLLASTRSNHIHQELDVLMDFFE